MTTPTAPSSWEADVLLRDGRTAHIRPVRADDKQLMTEFYARVSEESKYNRYFSPMPELSTRELGRSTEVDHDQRVAFVLLLRGQLIAVGRYDTVGDGEAEVAFLVEDAYQGRGISQILLEHLAQAARERGISRFVAEVLPDNTKMIHAFQEAGYHVTSGYDHGVVLLEFPIAVTDTAVSALSRREHEAEAASIQRFFNPRSVAIIGGSRREATIGQTLVKNLVNGDFTGRVYVVNPTAGSVSGLPAYRSVQDIDDHVDVAIVAVPAEVVPEVVLDCAAKGVHGLIVISAGFAEIGESGRKRQRRLVGLSRSYGLRLIGPNALGIINTGTGVRLNASLAPAMPPRGRAGFFCQSGALGTAILEQVTKRGLGLSTFVSAGNRADVSGNDLLQYWEEDPATEVIMMYLESIGNPRKFSRIARRVSLNKPIVAVRSGRSTQGVPMGHAVRRISAPPQAVDAMFRQAGVIQVDTLDQMFDVAQLLAHQPLPRGRRVAIVGNSDAVGLLAADAAVGEGLAVNRQVALPAEPTPEEFEDALDAAIDDPDVDAVIAVYIPPLNVKGDRIAAVLATVGEQSDKPIVSSFLGAKGVPELLRVPDVAGSSAGRGSVPSYAGVENAVHALARAVEYAIWLRTPDGPVPGLEVPDVRAAHLIVEEALRRLPQGGDLDQHEVESLLAAYGIDVWRATDVGSADEAVVAAEELGWDVVLKAAAVEAIDRPDQVRVVRHLNTAADVREAWRTLATPGAECAVQKTAPHGVPVTIRSLEDPLFGPVMSFGIAGPLTELVGDLSFRIPPLARGDAVAMVREVKAAPMLFGYHGSEPVDVAAIERLILQVAQLQNDLPQVSMLDLGLVLVGPAGAAVLSASVGLHPPSELRADWYVRRLNPAGPHDTLPA